MLARETKRKRERGGGFVCVRAREHVFKNALRER